VVAPNIEVSYKKRRRIIQSDDENEWTISGLQFENEPNFKSALIRF
jgi:hypothetical protein